MSKPMSKSPDSVADKPATYNHNGSQPQNAPSNQKEGDVREAPHRYPPVPKATPMPNAPIGIRR